MFECIQTSWYTCEVIAEAVHGAGPALPKLCTFESVSETLHSVHEPGAHVNLLRHNGFIVHMRMRICDVRSCHGDAKFVAAYRWDVRHVMVHMCICQGDKDKHVRCLKAYRFQKHATAKFVRHTSFLVHVRTCVRSISCYRFHCAHVNVCQKNVMVHM